MVARSSIMSSDVGIEIEGGVELESAPASDIEILVNELEMPIENLYRSAVKFYREMEGQYVVSYEDRMKFMAFSKQVKYGTFTEDAADAGFFDFTGADRQKAWKELGDMSRQDAMSGFTFLLDSVCPPFRDFVSSTKLQLEAERRKAAAEAEANRATANDSPSGNNNSSAVEEHIQLSQVLTAGPSPQDIERFESQRRQIQEALNKQTYNQFLVYAQQHFKDNVEQVRTLFEPFAPVRPKIGRF
uniref:ACB domain-containing protein n=1 Tax=Steinernema glaseri TaxID=37863 RepID=A0A1I7ZFC0_9BILA